MPNPFLVKDMVTKYELPTLPYSYDALEPHIDAKTMEIHHSKHHQTYVNGLNGALEKLSDDLQSKNLDQLLSAINSIPEPTRGVINFHGGGTDNHTLFWNNLSPNGGGEASGGVADAITKAFGNFGAFKEQFSGTAGTFRGSGWTWLVYNPSTQGVEIKAMPNQTSVRTEGLIPLLGIDVWEHAYYLKYQNRRPEYIAAWWNVVNWGEVDTRFGKAKA